MKSNAIRVSVWLVPAMTFGQTVPDPLTLEQALTIAQSANPQVQLARLQNLENEALALRSRARLGPQLDGIVGGAYQTSNLQGIGLTAPGLPVRVGPYTTFNARPVLTLQALNLPLLSEYRAAKARARESLHDASTAVEQTRLAVIELYLQALQAESRAGASEARRKTAEAVLAQVRDSEQAGTASKLDIARSRQTLEQETTVRIFAARDRDVLVTLLLKAIGVPAERVVALVPLNGPGPAPDDRGAIVTQALALRPELRALAERRESLRHDVKRAEQERLPKIAFSGDFGTYGESPAKNLSTYAVGGTMTFPIWTSGRIENDIKAARLRLEQWQQQKRELDNSIQQEITRALVEQEAAENARQAASRAVAAARETLELARLRYSAGLTTNLDVVTAQNNLAQAEEEEIRARYDGLLAHARLARARGDVMSFTRP